MAAREVENEVERKFSKMNARVHVERFTSQRSGQGWNGAWRRPVANPPRVQVNVLRDGKGEYFHVRHRTDVEIDVLDVKPADRHLLLMARAKGRGGDEDLKSKFLCGHDERAWFVAAIPESAPARNVQGAKDALKPRAVWDAIVKHRVPKSHRDRRRTRAFARQGEWFFVPRPELNVKDRQVLRNEPIRRGNGKPHTCQFLHRTGGESVWVNNRHPNGLTVAQLKALPENERKRPGRWMMRDARVYVKGAVRHLDHETIWLSCWHEVFQNTESQAKAMQHVAFLD